MRKIFPYLLLLLASRVDAQSTPETWPVVYSESYRLEAGEVRQIPLTWEGIPVRRFYLRLNAAQYYEAVLTRVRDGSILFMGHFEPNYGALIPWGQDEYAHLTLQTGFEGGLQVTLTLATDPAEDGLAVYSYHVNRFLEFYQQDDLARAEQELAEALFEDPEDELASFLQARLWEERGVKPPPPPAASAQSESLRTQAIVIDARIAIDQADHGDATALLQQALPSLRDEANRFEIYRILAEINRDLGNEHQLELIIQQAVSETQDATRKQEAESWRQ